MRYYRDPFAATEVGRLITAHLRNSNLTLDELAKRLRLRGGSRKMVNYLTGRHYLPLALARPIAELLNMDQSQLFSAVLLQYHPIIAVDHTVDALEEAGRSKIWGGIKEAVENSAKKNPHKCSED